MDLFYYGSQDIPLPPGGSRGTSAPPDGLYCESCSAAVSPEDLQAGRATEFYGLVVCQRCRLMTHADEKIELYFCDRCQVSVPVYRVDTGEALAGDGRILCVGCRSSDPGKPLRRMLAAGVAALLFCTGALLAVRALDVRDGSGPAAPSVPPGLIRLEALLDTPRDTLSPPEPVAATDDVEKTVADFRRRRDELLDRLADLNVDLARMQTDMRLQTERLEREIGSLESTVAQMDRESAALR